MKKLFACLVRSVLWEGMQSHYDEEHPWWRYITRSVVDDFFTALDPANKAIIQDAIAEANR
jgi:hypothetical protein